MDKHPHTETIEITGKKGEIHAASVTPYCYFQVHEIHATDSIGGKSTKVQALFVGNVLQLGKVDGLYQSIVNMPWYSSNLSMFNLMLDSFDMCDPLIPISVTGIEFLENCTFTINFCGMAIKEPSDSREVLKEKAIFAYEKDFLDCWPEPRDANQLTRFQYMIQRMRQQP